MDAPGTTPSTAMSQFRLEMVRPGEQSLLNCMCHEAKMLIEGQLPHTSVTEDIRPLGDFEASPRRQKSRASLVHFD